MGTLILTAMKSEAAAIGAGRASVIGIGAIHLDRIDSLPRVVIMAGLAGGLDPSLRTGDVVLDDPGGLVTALSSRPGLIRGRIWTADRVVASAEEKRSVFRETGCSCVDMEQGIVKRWADSRGVPLVGLRAICDTAADCLPPGLLCCVDAEGSARPGKIMALLLRRPGTITKLLRLRRLSSLALASLGRAVEEILARVHP